MARDLIQFEEPDRFHCECCGGRTTKLTRFVTREGGAFAVYFARFTDRHPDSCVSVLVGFGDWSEEADPVDRTAIAFRIWADEAKYQVGLIDAQDEWETEFLGKKLSREEALQSQWRQEVFDLSDHIVECDLPVLDYLNGR